jgi:hypothetical protein
MINYLKNLLSLIHVMYSFLKSSSRQRRFIEETIVQDIEQIKRGCDNTLGANDFKKIISYYGWAVAAILGESYSIFRGRSLSYSERYALTYLGGLTGLFDDFFDKLNTPYDHIKKLMLTPKEEFADNSHELLFVRFFRKALEQKDNPDLRDYCMRVYDIQILSKNQQSTSITKEEIEKITLEKGGLSILYFRTVFDEPMNDKENRMLFSMGALGQIANDIFDVYDDYQDGIHTLVTREKSIQNLRQYYLNLMSETFNLVKELNYPNRNKRRFLRYFSLIACRAMVGLDFLEKSQKTTNNSFSIEKYSRKELVCDMGKFKNILKLCHYYAKQDFSL